MKKVISFGLAVLMVFAISACDGEKFVKIGNQKWMQSNLNDASKGGKCYEDKPENCEKYGRLYTWDEAMKACPKGWNLPSDAEWEALVAFAGGMDVAGGKFKAESGWEKDGGGSDEYGFSALPGGRGIMDGSFDGVGNGGSWWSATEDNANSVYIWIIGYVGNKVYKRDSDKSYLLSVRCVKN